MITNGKKMSAKGPLCIHLPPQLTITPDVQYIIDPACGPTVDSFWVIGLGLRLQRLELLARHSQAGIIKLL
jgi:carbohydrate-selective porin OprB